MAKNQPQTQQEQFTFETDEERKLWFDMVSKGSPGPLENVLRMADEFVLEVRKRTKATSAPKELPEGSWPKLVERIAKYQAWNIDLDNDTEAPEGLDSILADLLIAVGRIPAARK